MSLFDEDLQEVEIDQVRYILRCNSYRKQELADNRADKIKFISTKIEKKNTNMLGSFLIQCKLGWASLG